MPFMQLCGPFRKQFGRGAVPRRGRREASCKDGALGVVKSASCKKRCSCTYVSTCDQTYWKAIGCKDDITVQTYRPDSYAYGTFKIDAQDFNCLRELSYHFWEEPVSSFVWSKPPLV